LHRVSRQRYECPLPDEDHGTSSQLGRTLGKARDCMPMMFMLRGLQRSIEDANHVLYGLISSAERAFPASVMIDTLKTHYGRRYRIKPKVSNNHLSKIFRRYRWISRLTNMSTLSILQYSSCTREQFEILVRKVGCIKKLVLKV